MNDQPVMQRPDSWLRGWWALLLGSVFGSWILWLLDPQFLNEDHVIEWMQVVILGGCVGLHGWRLWRLPPWTLGRWVRAGLGLLALSCMLKELEIDDWGLAGTEWILRCVLTVAWLIYAAGVVRHRSRLVLFAPEMIRSWMLRLALVAGLLYGLTIPFDKHLLALSKEADLFWEEVLELAAAFLMLMGAACNRIGQPDISRQPMRRD